MGNKTKILEKNEKYKIIISITDILIDIHSHLNKNFENPHNKGAKKLLILLLY